jgi:peptidoglycan/LPS O-acetylase OafA/YrhL
MDTITKDWKRAVSYGVVIWVILFIVASIFVGFGAEGNIIFGLIMIVLAFGLSYYLAGKVGVKNLKVGLQYGLVFAFVGLILDLIITARFTTAVFSQWHLWLGYVGIILAPAVFAQYGKK